MGASNAGRVGKNRDSRPMSGFIVLSTLTLRPPNVIHTAMPDRGKLVTLISCSNKRRRLLFTGDGRRSVYDELYRKTAHSLSKVV